MKYVVLVSHGQFADGLKDSLMMLAGSREDIISVGLYNGMGADQFAVKFENAIASITGEDTVILLGDLIGGAPLTTSMNVLAEKGLISNSVIFGGMNLPLALNMVLMKDIMEDAYIQVAQNEGLEGLKQFLIEDDEEEEEEEDL